MESQPVALSVVVCAQAPYADAPARRSGLSNPIGDALWAWVAESLVPLLNLAERLEREQVEAPLSIAVPPLACEMLADIEAAPAYLKYLERQAGAARAQSHIFGTRGQGALRDACSFWESWYAQAERDFRERYALDLLGALRGFQERGRVELLATAATGAPLALLTRDSSVEAQLALASEAFGKYFGRAPRGLWSCHGLENAGLRLARLIEGAGFEYVVEGGPTTCAREAARDGGTRYAGHASPGLREVLPVLDAGLPLSAQAPRLVGGVLVIRPHAAASEQAWHPSGYEGDERFLSAARRRHPGGLRLWRNTSEDVPLSQMEAYEPLGTGSICEAQAEHWLSRLGEWARESGQPQMCVALDAAMLGARWFEGHAWLGRALRRAASDPQFSLGFASHPLTLESLAQSPLEPPDPAGAAGEPGPTAWSNVRNEVIWAEIAECEAALEEWARRCAGTANPKLREILDHCARELLLIQSSEWPLQIASRPPEPRREDDPLSRLAEHIEAFRDACAIAETVARGEIMSEGQRAYLEALRERDDVFEHVSFEAWA